MGDEVAARKAALRRALRAEGKLHTDAERAELARRLCALLSGQPAWQAARSILFYMPLPDEPDLRPLADRALSEGKVVALPRYSAATGRYSPCRVPDVGPCLCPGEYGIFEPGPECPDVELNGLDFLLIPGIGFSLNGGRLGRGKGHYDRLLAEASGRKCGVAFDWQVTVELPTERHDILLDYIVTPTRWHSVK